MRVRVRVTTSACGFCGFCGSFSQTVDIAYFSRFLACGSLVDLLLACGSRVDLRSKVVIKGKPQKNLTPQSKSC